MAKILIADLFQAELWTPEFINEAPVLQNILTSGILVNNSELTKIVNATSAGSRFELPYIEEPDYTEPESMDDSDDDLTTKKISWANQFAVLGMYSNSYKMANIVDAVNRSKDPLKLIRDTMIGRYWGYDLQNRITSIVAGIVNKAGDDLVLDVADDSSDGDDVLISQGLVIDAIAKQGDAQDKFTFMFIHSKVYSDLKRQNLITTIPPSTVGADPIQMYGNYRIVVNDKMPVIQGDNKKKYVSLFSQNGLIAHADKTLGSDMPSVELYRNPLSGKGAGDTTLITRKGHVVHPIGWSYNKTDMNPTLANLGNKDNWTNKFKTKQHKFVALITN